MPDYRRTYVTGGTFFFTVTLPTAGSFQKCVERGFYDSSWASPDNADKLSDMGEPA
jgi:hypothetical protein